MPVTFTATGDSAAACVQEILTFLGTVQGTLNNTIKPGAPAATTTAPKAEEAAPAAAAKPAAKGKAAKTEKVPEPKHTLQDALDLGLKIVGDGTDEAIMARVQKINTSFGVKKARELPPEKVDGYVDALNEAFPDAAGEEEEGGLF